MESRKVFFMAQLDIFFLCSANSQMFRSIPRPEIHQVSRTFLTAGAAAGTARQSQWVSVGSWRLNGTADPWGCDRMSQEVIGSMLRINGLFHLPINGDELGWNHPLILASWDIQVWRFSGKNWHQLGWRDVIRLYHGNPSYPPQSYPPPEIRPY